jgi:hypothetical protein
MDTVGANHKSIADRGGAASGRRADKTEVLCAVSRLVVVRPVGAAPVRWVYSRPEAPPQAGCVLYNPLVTAL